MGAHFHEHHADVVRWPWKIFCRKWARLLAATVGERKRELKRKRQAQAARNERGMSEMRAAHQEHHGGLGG
jgi:hypothetical protein